MTTMSFHGTLNDRRSFAHFEFPAFLPPQGMILSSHRTDTRTARYSAHIMR